MYTEKEAYQGPISKANQILPEGLNFYSLQNLLIGNPILNNTTPSSISSDLTSWVVRLIEHNYVEQLQYDKTDSTLRNTQLLTQGQRSNSLTQNLNNFSLINLIKFSTDRRINIVTDTSAMLVEINYNNINFDTELTYPFSIPKNYTLK